MLVLFAAVFARAVTPAGWMPNPAGDLGVPFVICTAAGGHLAGHGGAPAKPPGERHDTCVYAGHHAAPGGAEIAVAGSTRLALIEPARPAPVAEIVQAPRHREQAARAPPIRV
jgi:hypothetical protein